MTLALREKIERSKRSPISESYQNRIFGINGYIGAYRPDVDKITSATANPFIADVEEDSNEGEQSDFETSIIETIQGIDFFYPIQLTPIIEEIRGSVELLSYELGWDGDTGATISVNSWKNAVQFLFDYAFKLRSEFNLVLSEPEISPVPDGSIDVTWHTTEARMLINFKADSDTASFYGDYYSDNQSFKGKMELGSTQSYFLGKE